jgi:2-oxoglutarate/2-oxoacid ferredoxin oxidoreductase subunit alpha
LLRARWLVDVDCWSQVRGQPIKPRAIEAAIRSRLAQPTTMMRGGRP